MMVDDDGLVYARDLDDGTFSEFRDLSAPNPIEDHVVELMSSIMSAARKNPYSWDFLIELLRSHLRLQGWTFPAWRSSTMRK